jgi:DNA-binding SARP family transcriptional activator
MRLHALTGRRHAAILQYERLREALSREIGAEPGASTQRYEPVVCQLILRPLLAAPRRNSRHNLPASLNSSSVGSERCCRPGGCFR